MLDAGEALILIDGIDEFAHKNREEIRDQLASLGKTFEGNYLVFTTRPGVVDDDWFADLEMMCAKVNPLGEHERTELIKHWHDAAAEAFARAEAETIARVRVEKLQAGLIEQLQAAPDIALLGASPLLCAAICLYHYMTDGDLPKKQAELCDVLCKLLIQKRDFARKAPDAVDKTAFGLLDYDHKALLILMLAQKALRNGESALEPDIADALIAEKLRGFRLSEVLEASFVRKRLVERSGVLREAYGGGVDFAHNTLRDFLAGRAFVAEPGGVQEMAKNVGDQAWHRPIIFAASDPQHDVAAKLVRALLNRGTRSAKIIALLCDASASFLDPELRDRVTRLGDDVLPPKNLEEAALLATLGDAIIDRLLGCKTSKTTAHASARTLRLIGKEKAKDALRAYWDTDQQEIAEELAQLFHLLAIPYWQREVQKAPELGEEPNLPDSVAQNIHDIEPLRELKGLLIVDLRNTKVTNIEPLRGLKELQGMGFYNTKVSDIEPLNGLKRLRVLQLNNTKVADTSVLDHIEGLKILS